MCRQVYYYYSYTFLTRAVFLMATDFQKAARLGACLSKDYAQDLFRLMVNYHDISASEAASRLNIHIRTTQDFLETLAELGILNKQEQGRNHRPGRRAGGARRN